MPVSAKGTAYDLTGPTDAPVVALIHGLGLTRQSTWAAIAASLQQRFRVLSYDLLGHGESHIPQGPVDLTVLGEQLIDLMDELGIERAALVGFSLGGMINRRCVMDHPDRVSAVAVLNSPHERGDAQQKLVEARARDSTAGGPEATIDAALERWFTPEFRSENKAVVEGIRDTVLANDPENYAAHRRVLAAGVTELIRPRPPLTCPLLVVTSEHDTGSTPAMSRAIAAETAGAQVAIIPALRHMGLVERPDLFLNLLEPFLVSHLMA